MLKTVFTATCWTAIAFSLVYLLVGHNGGIVFQNPMAAVGTALIGLGMIKHFGMANKTAASGEERGG